MISKADIVLAEDNPTDAEFIFRALKQNNLFSKLAHFQDGADVLDYIFARGNYSDRDIAADAPKLVLLDIKMPKVNGLEVLQTIKQDERTRAIPVVVLTSSRQFSDVVKSYQAGANSYVVKPLDFDEFVNTVKELSKYWVSINQAP